MAKHSNKANDNGEEEMRGFLDMMLPETNVVRELKGEIASLQEEISRLIQINEELCDRMEENEDTIRKLKAAYNKMLSDANSYQANTIVLSGKPEPEPAAPSSKAADGILVFESLKQKIDNFCSDSLLADADSLTDENYYRYVARFYRTMYEWILAGENEDLVLENLLERFWLQKEASFASNIYEKLMELVIAAKKSCQDIFTSHTASHYPRYELVYPEAGSTVGNDYTFIKEDKNPQRKIVRFCIYPGILETSHNNDTNEDKTLWRSKPVVWTD